MDSGLPEYTPSSSGSVLSPGHQSTARYPTEHRYNLVTSNGRPWLTLKVFSKAPASNYLPAFYQGETVTGIVQLSLSTGEPIKSISVQIVGQMTSSVTDVLSFIQLSSMLWTRTAVSGASSSPAAALDKLVGNHEWPFNITLPDECELKSPNGSLEKYPLPASFSERMARVHIQYQLVVTVHRSRFRVGSTLGTVIGYCPIIRPSAPTPARQLAYIENAPLVGPDGDPDGWKCLQPLRIIGSVFSTRTVEATCSLALAEPLCYTRGSAIPCLMTIETSDPQALLLLSAPRSPVVRLVRTISTNDPTAGSVGVKGAKKLPRLGYESNVEEITTAVWWPDPHGSDASSPQRKVLHGEIHLSKALKPSCSLGRFEISVCVPLHSKPSTCVHLPCSHAQYSVAVFCPRAVAFLPESGAEAVLLRQPVVIGTAYAPGPRPRVYSPPGYDDANSTGQASEFRLFR
ncbi:hypothetical protein C8Q73DRAFT_742388 [Cubamyces lactineus]|nr:hypothetical protein C8Q73DRAFT_742388 [Cubamyces lactineus]